MRWPWKRGKGRAPHLVTGEAGEKAAARYLKRRGYRIIDRNVRFRWGEVDLVAWHKATETLCFVEVRSRVVAEGAEPPITEIETVTPRKRRRILAAAKAYLATRGGTDRRVRFDIMAVRFSDASPRRPAIKHFEGAFGEGGRPL